jgi:hypothetical protein
MRSFLIAVTLLLAAPLLAQYDSAGTGIPYSPGAIQTPHYHLGSGGEPSVMTIPPVVLEDGNVSPYESEGGNAPPASTTLLATRHFDFIVSPDKVVPGSMEDTSISLGDYARQLRAAKSAAPTPDSMARPLDSR